MKTVARLPLSLLCAVVGVAALAPPVRASGQYTWPLEPDHVVTAEFDPPPQPWLPGHRGVDLAAEDGQPVLAAGEGTVAFAGSVAGKPVVSVDHGAIRTTYEPVVASVQTGQHVGRGEQIGVVAIGHDGCTVDACLHWGARRGEVYLDPTSLVGQRRVRLLPL